MAISSTTQNRIVWGVRILLALAFGAAGAAKLAGVPQMVATFEAIGIGQWFQYVTGGIEVLGFYGTPKNLGCRLFAFFDPSFFLPTVHEL